MCVSLCPNEAKEIEIDGLLIRHYQGFNAIITVAEVALSHRAQIIVSHKKTLQARIVIFFLFFLQLK